MKYFTRMVVLATCFTLFAPQAMTAEPPQGVHAQQDPQRRQDVPRIDVAFLLDTTSSMTDLIQGAKVKIWSIAKEMLDADIAPELRMALIGYRDRGDAYVTKVFDLTDDIDRIYGELLKFEAQGGGDRPESVNEALDVAVNDLSWGRGHNVYRVIFLVGDSPPKMNYQDDIKYWETARQAARQDIIINTVLAGGARDTRKFWREIANYTQGRFAEIPQSGNMHVVETPYDQQIQTLNQRMNDTAMLYGKEPVQNEARGKLDRARKAPQSVIADKSAFQRSKGARQEIITGAGELINDLAEGRVTLDEVEPEELPQDLRKLSPEEQKARISERTKEREELRRKIDDLVAKRDDFIKKAQASKGKTDSFDGEVGAMIREQGAAKGILYGKK